jgi:hypothetical protein
MIRKETRQTTEIVALYGVCAAAHGAMTRAVRKAVCK